MGEISSTTENYCQCIEAAIARLRQLAQRDRQTEWRMSFEDAAVAIQCDPNQWETWKTVTLNERQHIAWPAGRQVLWLGQAICMPEALADYPLAGFTARLSLIWWAEQADVYVNGRLVQQGDLFDISARVLLTEALVPGSVVAVAIRLVSPAHDAGALVRSHFLCEPSTGDRIDPGAVADELAVLQTYAIAFRAKDLSTLAVATQDIAWEQSGDAIAFDRSLQHLRDRLTPFAQEIKQRQINWIGHAHLDLAWLWPVAETWEAAERTFVSALNLQKDFEELNFCHSSPALYEWIEQHRPALFAQIQQRVAEGRWEVAAGLWVEPELNLISGESLVRQVLYGQRYTQERFGHISRVAWLPDSFGFCNQLPQILKQGGVDYFLTQKLRWNDTTQFPHEAFWWQAPDGTRTFSIMTPPIGESIDPLKMSAHAKDWEAKTSLKESFWLPGVGDHGGGPTRDMLEVARKWQQSPLFPQLKSSTMTEFCQQVESNLQDVPVWDDELYLEFHRGCYTSHADQKRYNRRCEHLLTEAEMFSAIATLTTNAPYPKAELETAWKKVLFNQFHDILPGSSIPEVFADANREWELALQTALDLREKALEAIAAQIRLPEPPVANAIPVVVHNSLNWERSEVVRWQAPDHHQGTVLDSNGQPLPTQYNSQTQSLSFWANAIPSVGYRVFWYVPTALPTPSGKAEEWILDNGHLRVEICERTGNVRSIWDYAARRNVLAGPGNVLQFFQDRGQYWDAWNIDPNYAQHPLEAAVMQSIALAGGTVEPAIQVERCWRNATFVQTYRLGQQSSALMIDTQVDWQETHVLVKAAFPLGISADYATYETPCGAIERPTLPNPQPLTEHQKAKWEVPALHWADLTQAGEEPYGVSLLNDCKYGYDAQPDCLRLTLLRSPQWPDPNCDRGFHSFTYALYPHSGSWQQAQTHQKGYELNRPLIAKTLAPAAHGSGTLNAAQSFLSGFPENLVLMALKQSEDSPQNWIVRFYEACGQPAKARLESTLPLKLLGTVDGLERPIKQSDDMGGWEVRSQCWS
ncbi:alpha-mannosidase [Altericista sp. CCNU0014]|uniref:alpha-mannosidase n=1 Tax=Altericista sp. CCNU0014 TaxID=3082949 RepID=UPI00384CCDDD